MPKLTKNIVIGIVVAVILIFGGISLYTLWQKSKIPQAEIPTPTPQAIGEILNPGTVGEIEKTETSKGSPPPELPPVIFNTAGIINEIKVDRLIVQGDGSNFADRSSRELILIFIDSTITFGPNQKTKYQGIDGLKYLKVGMEILIEGEENIRGKTEFKARTINTL